MTGWYLAPLAPFVGFAGMGVAAWFGARLPERLVSWVTVSGCMAAVPGAWFAEGWLERSFVVLVGVLGALIGMFSRRYLHREPGFLRFHLLLCLFVAAAEVVVVAHDLRQTLVGWEVCGLASALLIAFFHQRRGPLDHGLRAFCVYRLCDIGLVLLVTLPHAPAPVAGGLVLLAAIGKSAQFPLGGWLPRAMEGPTPSSAIFYGAISVSLGPYLLLHTRPLWDASTLAHAAIITVGVLTALHATVIARVQTDIKSALAYASMTQVALVFIEVGLGWTVLAAVHLAAHAVLRTGQFLRSPSLLHDHHLLEQDLAGPLPPTGRFFTALPEPARIHLYRYGIARGHTDTLPRAITHLLRKAARR
ncbi:proton-conducting transporter membrane subunit [Actinokineospora sp. UTMC 2448]|uniref:proton-conducting transporter transmembrane domain-containing protein n=1 Tax=Actinokineospora sp. UTMC 2448 TaxID=2268449 RepID=UPI0021642EAA|nr:proton-conducting transporter membrane subunit [Actinokineospora sp. UTMC 2448]UVS81413.1 NADH-quinone oxidoreductase subunit 12 [Actinokineospora sp. UTMC 2448]